MAQLEVTYVASHKLSFSKTRGRGVTGGWRPVPRCVCGWNTGRGIHGSLFPTSFASEELAGLAFMEHLANEQLQPREDVGHTRVEVATRP